MTQVHPLWQDEIESLEAISQNEDDRRIFLRMASLAQTGRMSSFVVEVELARDESFLLAVEEYLVRTHQLH